MKTLVPALLLLLALALPGCGDDAQTHTTAADETTTSATAGADTAEQPGTVPEEGDDPGTATRPPGETPAGTTGNGPH